jgi:predicted dehydrogenase
MSTQETVFTRRRFLASSASAAAIVVTPQLVSGRALGKDGAVAPSERIVMGGLGIGGRGSADLKDLLAEPVVQFVAVCDARAERREAVKKMVDERYGNGDCATYRDIRDFLANRGDIDALLIATGDRWHTMASILAAKAGKDIYCEKPCSLTIAQSRALAETIRRYGRVFQAGTQRRNIGNFQLAVHLARSGKLGKLKTLHANTQNPATKQDWLPAEPEPPKDVVDWDEWLGPCPWRPYNKLYVQGRWRGHFDFHGGGILEWGAHTVDQCQWANDADATGPIEYEPQGSHVHALYANGVKLVMRDTGWLGLGSCAVRFEGEEGWVEVGDSGKMELGPAALRSEHRVFTMVGTDPKLHLQEFLRCVKSRAMPSANADVACQSHIACHCGYIAWQLGRKLKWDPVKEEFIGDDEANRMRSRAMREPWRI